MKIIEMSELPIWQQGVYNSDGWIMSDRDGPPVWSGKIAPPAIGERINVRINSLGPATVVGYFTEDGYLGVRVHYDAPPKWFLKQNGGNVTGHVFGPKSVHSNRR